MNRTGFIRFLILVGALLLAGSGCGKELPGARVVQPSRQNVEVRFLATGTTEARQIEIASENFGTLEEVLVAKDDVVKEGQVLAMARDVEAQDRIDILMRDLATHRSSRTEMIQRMELRRAQLQAANEQRVAEKRRAQAQYRQTVAGVTPEQLQQAEASVDEAQATLRQSRRERERLQKLFEEDIASQAQVEKAQMEEEIALARRTRALKQLEELERGLTEEAVAAARAQLGVADVSLSQNSQLELEFSIMAQQLRTKDLEIARWEAELASLRQRLQRGRLTAPVDGQIIEVHRYPGEMVHRGTTIFTLLDPEEIWVEGEVAEQDSGYVSVGQKVNVRFPSRGGETFEGTVQSTGAALRTPQGSAGNARFLQIKVELETEPDHLKPGIEADIEGSRILAQDALTVPHQAVVREGGESYVMVVRNSQAYRQPVEVGASDAERVEIRSGLSESDLVVIDHPSRLQDGTTVEITPG